MSPPHTRVLVVDDHRTAPRALGVFLRLCGWEVQLSGDAALKEAPQFQPTLFILDIQMRGMDGLETARRLRAQAWAHRLMFASPQRFK